MSKGTTYTATWAGQTFRRTSHRAYTHAVVYRYTEHAGGGHSQTWSVTFSQSAENAQREQRRVLGLCAHTYTPGRRPVRDTSRPLVSEAHIVTTETKP
jgi:hypothetical protein